MGEMIESPAAHQSWQRLMPAEKYLLVFLGLCLVVYVGLDLTPSHYSLGLKMLGVNAHPMVGQALPVRSDEWMVLTPLFQIAVHGHFAATDMISPYHETLKGFLALPITDWSLIFKPQLWAFWVLPPDYAYSFYFALLWGALLVGYTVLTRQLGAGPMVAIAGAVILGSSHFVQVWWTSNAPTFAFAPLPLIAFLSPVRPVAKALFVFYGACVWIFGYVYPPFIIPAAFAMGILVLAFRRDILTPTGIAVGVFAVAAAGAVFYLYFGDLIAVMRNTVYPGSRFVDGGGVQWLRILAHLLPYFTTSLFTPLLPSSNECEVAVVATLLPLAVLAFVRYRSFNNISLSAVSWTTLGLLLMFCWVMFPIPAKIGAVFLWPWVPASRMLWGFGLLLTLSLVVFASRLEFTLSRLRLSIFAATLIAAWLVSKIGFTSIFGHFSMSPWEALKRSWFDWVGIIPFIAAGIATWLWPDKFKAREMVLAAVAATSLITFGTFNPIQQATHFFNIPSTAFLQRARQDAANNPNGWALLRGDGGALLNGAGIPAVNHVLTSPVMSFWARVFPNMSPQQRHLVFDRYAHIVPDFVNDPYSPQPDVIVVPVKVFQKAIER